MSLQLSVVRHRFLVDLSSFFPLPDSGRGLGGEVRGVRTPNPEFRIPSSGGSALILTVGYLAALTIFASAFLAFLNHTISNSNRTQREQICLNIAEGGVDKALAELRMRPTEYHGETYTPLGEGRFSVEVLRGKRSGEYRITSTGILEGDGYVVASVRVSVEAILSPDGHIRELCWVEQRKGGIEPQSHIEEQKPKEVPI